ncbi:MAG: hypothetical protein ACR2GQ_06485 [Gemmatimonadota bacterium]
MEDLIPFEIEPQPNDTSCGPTCLQAVYRYYGDSVAIKGLLAEVPELADGGTLGVHLANHALKRGYRVTVYTWNLQAFDPTWFGSGAPLRERLAARVAAGSDRRYESVSGAYLEFLDAGGELRMEDLTAGLLRSLLRRRVPILAGLSATFLYRSMRERPSDQEDDDIRGAPVGHFVVLSGYDAESRTVFVNDPQHEHPFDGTHSYTVDIDRLIGAVYLGVLTYDGNLVAIEPISTEGAPGAHHRSS